MTDKLRFQSLDLNVLDGVQGGVEREAPPNDPWWNEPRDPYVPEPDPNEPGFRGPPGRSGYPGRG